MQLPAGSHRSSNKQQQEEEPGPPAETGQRVCHSAQHWLAGGGMTRKAWLAGIAAAKAAALAQSGWPRPRA
jgi:hypothetical protein